MALSSSACRFAVRSAIAASPNLLASTAACRPVGASAVIVTIWLCATGVADTCVSRARGVCWSFSPRTTRSATAEVGMSFAIVSTSRAGSPDSETRPNPNLFVSSREIGVTSRSTSALYTLSAAETARAAAATHPPTTMTMSQRWARAS